MRLFCSFYILLFSILSVSAQQKNPFDIDRDQLPAIQEEFAPKASPDNPVDLDNPFEKRKEISGSAETRIQLTEQQETKEIPDIPKQRKSGSKSFVFWIILFLVIILASVINLKRNSFSNLYRSIANENYLRLIQREENNGLSPLFIILNGIFYINGGLFIYLLMAHFGYDVNIRYFVIASAAIFIIYFIRIIAMNLLAFVFPVRKEAMQYNFTILLYNNFIGILLILINLMIAFSPGTIAGLFVYLGIVLVLLFYILRVFRGFLNTANYLSNNIFHFFLYLCTFEIATVFILIKWVQNATT